MNEQDINERFKLGISYRNEGRFKNAIEEFQSIVESYPNHPKIAGILTVLAGVYDDLGDVDNAMIYFKRATQLSPKSEMASIGLYLSYVELEMYNDAVTELERYLTNYPAKDYKVTLAELLGDLESGFAIAYKDIILGLAKKHSVSLGKDQ